MEHYPVLLTEVIEGLSIDPGGIYLDGTLGAGGHSYAIANRLNENGLLLGVDADTTALALAKERLSAFSNVHYFHKNFAQLSEVLLEAKVEQINGILLDIGVSSMQIDRAERGFSFRDDLEGPLDMRMNPMRGISAKEYLLHASTEELEKIIREYGEERYARRVAQAIHLKRNTLQTTKDLADVIRRAIPGPKGKIDKATRTFQAIRIHVNQELDVLKDVLPDAIRALKVGGRLLVITFHSLEDRIVKWAFRDFAEKELVKIITKKPIIASDKENRENSRSRSAKLRIVEKI